MIISLIINFLGLPIIHRIENKSNQMQEKLVDQKVKQARLNQLPYMKNELMDYKNKNNALAVVFDSSNEVKFIEDIESMASKTGNLIKLRIEKPIDTSKIVKTKKDNLTKNILASITYKKYFPMQINLRGNYNGLINFIYQLENSELYINVVSIDSKKQKVVQDSTQTNVNSSINGIFSLKSQPVQNDVTKNKEKEILNSNIKVLVYLK